MKVTKVNKKKTALGIAFAMLTVCQPVLAEEVVNETRPNESTVVETMEVADTTSQTLDDAVVTENVENTVEEEQELSPAEALPEEVKEQSEPLEGKEGQQEEAIGKTITQVNISGNNVVPVDNFFSSLRAKPGSTLTLDAINQDMQLIYETGWFYDIQVEYSFVPEGVRVDYKVQENPVLSKVEIQGSSIYADNLLQRLLGLEYDQVINSKQLSEGMRNIEAAYNKDGYILARVSDIDMRPDGLLVLTINEGIIEGFSIKGNKKTKDYVILRELRLKEGEPFNVNDGRRSMQKVYNLGYFEDVNIKLNPGRTPNGVEVEITVVETTTGTFGIGAGYSEADGLIGMISIGDKNFRGIGDSVNIRWEFGGARNTNYDFSYYRPWLDKKATSIFFNLYDLTYEYQELYDDGSDKAYYDRQRKGVEVTLARPANDYITNSIRFKVRDDKYRGAVSGEEPQHYEEALNKSEELAKNFGTTHSVTLARTLDTRDNIYNPSTGNYAILSGEFAGLGGDFSFNKFTLEGRTYYPVGLNKVFALRGVVGYATGTMPLSQRFAIGGDNYLRGYKDDRFHGYKLLSGTAEYRFPLTKNFQGVVFSDIGYAWGKHDNFNLGDLEYGYGLGVRINSPLGPIRLDYAYGDKWRIHFSFGGQF